MVEQLDPGDWAWQLAAEVYRLNLDGQLTRRTTLRGLVVTDAKLAVAIRNSFTQVHEPAFIKKMMTLATDEASKPTIGVVSGSRRPLDRWRSDLPRSLTPVLMFLSSRSARTGHS